MIEVNFFEKKARNVLPHLMVLFFFVGLIAISVYFFLLHGLYVNQNNQNTQVIQQQSEDVALAREMQSIDVLTEQNVQTISTLEDEQYPIVYLTDDITGMIPDSEEAVLSFELTDGTDVLIQLNQSVVEDSADLIVAFEALPYTSRVQMNRLEQQGEEGEYLIELSLTID
ncbi:MAG: hypothetical protein JJU01_09485 [Alkalibacterium sp.]|nr:hypothetical protein [Alkalibacterium sp.]